MRGIVFDLDMTLVDSSIAEKARIMRDWKTVYALIPQFRLYNGFDIVFEFIRKNHNKVAIVSTAPGTYVSQVVDHFNIPCDSIVAYHDAKPIKPHSAPMLKAAGLLSLCADDIVNFGDRCIDILAGYSAGMHNSGCLWGSNETHELVKMSQIGMCDVITSPTDIIPKML